MEETQNNLNDDSGHKKENAQQLPEAAPLASATSAQRLLAVTFGLLQLAWLGWLAFVAWKVLSS